VPGNWPQWHPSSLRVSGTTDTSLEPGECCIEEFRVAGREGACEWVATERVPGRRWVIETQTQGGTARITYVLAGESDGTRFERTLQYRMPNLLLAFLDAAVLRRRIVAESEEALRRLKARLESSAPEAGAATA